MADYKIKYNKKNRRYVVFEVPKKKGLWKIKKVFKTKKEAEDWIKARK